MRGAVFQTDLLALPACMVWPRYHPAPLPSIPEAPAGVFAVGRPGVPGARFCGGCRIDRLQKALF
jgi:hypothetical protein